MRAWGRPHAKAANAAFDALLHLIPKPWSADEFVQRIAAKRGRPIVIVPLPLTPQLATGYRLTEHDRDVIVVADSATGERRDAIIGHELAHIVMSHEPPVSFKNPKELGPVAGASSDELIDRFLRHRDFLIESGALARERYDLAIEREAEAFATRLVAHTRNQGPGDDGTEHDRVRDRLL
jgi:hypothetical protein